LKVQIDSPNINTLGSIVFKTILFKWYAFMFLLPGGLLI